MKLSQKLILTIDDFKCQTTYAGLDEKLKPLAKMLEDSDMPILGVIRPPAFNDAFVKLEYAGSMPAKQKKKSRLFGYEEDEFLAKQY